MLIKVVSLGPTELLKSKNGRSYSCFELTYKNNDGKTMSRKIMSFNKEVFTVLQDASPGQAFDVTVEKKGDFWEWTAVGGVSEQAAAAAPTQTQAAPKGGAGGWKKDPETDVRIARSVALKGAIDWLAREPDSSVDEVLAIANTFEDYLLNGLRHPAIEKAVKKDTITTAEAIGEDDTKY